MFRKLIAFLTGGVPVILEDFQFEEYKTIAYQTKFGFKCHVYWLTKTGDCKLLEDGTVDRKSVSSYIHYWKKG